MPRLPLTNSVALLRVELSGCFATKNYAADSSNRVVTRSVSFRSNTIVAGGAELYAHALAAADKVYLTTVRKTFDGDAFFPVIPNEEFTCISSQDINAVIPYTFAVYERAKHNMPLHTGACGADELSR
jgi:dihydrofolate reductase